jgi:hypothetical protein
MPGRASGWTRKPLAKRVARQGYRFESCALRHLTVTALPYILCNAAVVIGDGYFLRKEVGQPTSVAACSR